MNTLDIMKKEDILNYIVYHLFCNYFIGTTTNFYSQEHFYSNYLFSNNNKFLDYVKELKNMEFDEYIDDIFYSRDKNKYRDDLYTNNIYSMYLNCPKCNKKLGKIKFTYLLKNCLSNHFYLYDMHNSKNNKFNLKNKIEQLINKNFYVFELNYYVNYRNLLLYNCQNNAIIYFSDFNRIIYNNFNSFKFFKLSNKQNKFSKKVFKILLNKLMKRVLYSKRNYGNIKYKAKTLFIRDEKEEPFFNYLTKLSKYVKRDDKYIFGIELIDPYKKNKSFITNISLKISKIY